MGKPWQWLRMAPFLYPLVYAHGQRHALRPAPALTCFSVHNSSLAIGAPVCEKEKFFWQALRDCRYSSVPPRLDHDDEEGGGGGEEGDESISEGDSSGAWNHEVPGANFKREQVAGVNWLKLTDRELQMQCRVETLRSSGPGGQHRNKTESAVRLLHLPTGCVAFAAEDRSQHKNRTKAFKRLREVIALEVRRPVELVGYKPPLELMRILPSVPKASRKREGGQKIGPNHDDFVQGIQPLVDLLGATKGSISECAAILGLSTGALSRLIVSNRMLWKGVNNLRAEFEGTSWRLSSSCQALRILNFRKSLACKKLLDELSLDARHLYRQRGGGM